MDPMYLNRDLTCVDMVEANLCRTDLSGADLSNANLFAASLTGVIWGNTTCPNGAAQSTQCPRTSEGCPAL